MEAHILNFVMLQMLLADLMWISLIILFSFLKITINMIIKQIKLITVNIKEHMLF